MEHGPAVVMASLAAMVTAPCRAPRAAAAICTTSLSSGRPGSCTASAAMPCTCARVGITTTCTPRSSASWAAASAAPIESGSLGSTMTSSAPVASIAARIWPVLGPAPRAALDDLGPGLGEQLDETRAGSDDHQLAPATLGALLAGARHLLGEVGDLDPAGRTGPDAGLDRGTDVVDVDVHVPEALTADHDEGVAERCQGLAERRDGVVVGVEEVHHLVRRPVLGQVTGRELGHRDRGRADLRRGRRRVLAGDRGLGRVEHHAQPTAARVDDTRLLEHGQLFRREGERLAGGVGGRVDHGSEPVVRHLGSLGGAPRDAAFATERIVPSTGSPTAEYAASVASSIPSANTEADRSSGPAWPIRRRSAPTSWLRITPELPRAPSSAPRE